MRVSRLAVAAVSVGCLFAALTAGSAAGAAAPPSIDPSSIVNGGRPCTASTPPQTVGGLSNVLQFVPIDNNQSGVLDATVAVWPLSDPSAEHDFDYPYGSSGHLVTVNAQAALSTDGDYGWRAKVSDANGTSEWTSTCTFRRDTTAPTAPPTLTSPNFPTMDQGAGPVGQEPVFQLNGNGDPDVAGFQYDWSSPLGVFGCASSGPQGQIECPPDFLSESDVIRADHPGGTATLRLNAPGSGPATMTVAAIDAMGNRTAQVQYQIFVPDSSPKVTQVKSGPICGDTVRLAFSPHAGVSRVTSYTYFTANQQVHTVAASKNGTATITLPVDTNSTLIDVTSHSADGFASSTGFLLLNVDPQGTVTSSDYPNDGQPHGGKGVAGEFLFDPPFNTDWTASYRYRFDNGPSRTISADPNADEATVSWTPKTSGVHRVTLTALGASGNDLSCAITYTFTVAP